MHCIAIHLFCDNSKYIKKKRKTTIRVMLSPLAINYLRGNMALRLKIGEYLGIGATAMRQHVRINKINGVLTRHSVLKMISDSSGLAFDLLVIDEEQLAKKETAKS